MSTLTRGVQTHTTSTADRPGSGRRLKGGDWVQHRSTLVRVVSTGLLDSARIVSGRCHRVRGIGSVAAAAGTAGAGLVASGSAISTTARLASAAVTTARRHPEQWPQAAAAGTRGENKQTECESCKPLHDRGLPREEMLRGERDQLQPKRHGIVKGVGQRVGT